MLIRSGYIVPETPELKKELTVRAVVNNEFSFPPPPFKVFRKSKKGLCIPRYFGIEKFGIPKEDRRPEPSRMSEDVKFIGKLRDETFQNEALRKGVEVGHGILSLDCGFGKTVTAIAIACKLKYRTMIVVHKEFLANQWEEKIKQFCPDATIGRVQQNKLQVDCDFVIAMLQSLSTREYQSNDFDSIGTMIVDECFVFDTLIHTDQGLFKIGILYNMWRENKELPLIYSFNREKKTFELKRLTHAWKKKRNELVKVKLSKRVIKCTPEHKILTVNGYVEAKNLTTDSIVISKYDKNHQDNIIAPALNDDQKQIVYGSYLGDGHIQRTTMKRYRLQFIHGEKQRSYCEWKANMFNVTNIQNIEKNGYSQKPACRFSTRIFDSDIEFPKNTRQVPNEILERMDMRGIAIWFMDDGSISSNRIVIHTNNFGYIEQEKFVKYFKLFDIDCTIHKSKNKYYYLQFNVYNSKKLIHNIKPYIHESILYKIRNERQEEYKWNQQFLDYGTLRVSSVKYFENKKRYGTSVYDIEVEDNHNFVIGTSTVGSSYVDGPVVSNCHHICAKVFSQSLFKLCPKHIYGLSATPERKDGLTKVLHWFIGPTFFSAFRENQKQVEVFPIKYECPMYTQSPPLQRNGKLSLVNMITELVEHPGRNKMILDLVRDIYKQGRKLLVLSDRRFHCEYLHNKFPNKSGLYMGGMKQEKLNESAEKPIIFATFSQAHEGLDIPSLDTVILATPKSDIKQSVGRILRETPGKKNVPHIYDIIDNWSILNAMYYKRSKVYRDCGFNIPRVKNSVEESRDDLFSKCLIIE
jgi:superfamily II DNA or RNA helicase